MYYNLSNPTLLEDFFYEEYFPEPRSQKDFIRYKRFINSRRFRKIPEGVYTENQHILPKSMCPKEWSNRDKDHPNNLVPLTYHEHLLVHLILWKAFGGKMAQALYMMSGFRKYNSKLSFRQMSKLREENSLEISKIHKGRAFPPEFGKAISDAKTGEIPIHKDGKCIRIKPTENLQSFLDNGWTPGLGYSPREGMTNSEESNELRRQRALEQKDLFYASNLQKYREENDGPWNKGKTLDPVEDAEYLQKLSDSHKGNRNSDEAYEKMAQKRRGRKWMTKNGKGKTVPTEEIEKYQEEGWVLGKPDKRSISNL